MHQTIIVTDAFINDIAQFKNPTSKKERCGLLLGSRDTGETPNVVYVTGIREVKNSSPTPKESFEIRMKHAVAVGKTLLDGQEVVGAFHTHPRKSDTELSSEDISQAVPDSINVMFHPRSMTLTYYDDQGFIRKKGINDA